MEQHQVAVCAQVWLALSIAAAVAVASDIVFGGRRHPMAVMSVVWPLTMLYWGPLGLVFYFWFGRAERISTTQSRGRHHPSTPPMWRAAFLGATHCGAGCALGDFAGEWVAFGLSLTIAGSELGGKLLLAFVLAYALGVAFQFWSIAPMRGLGLREGVIAAIKADTFSLVAYEIGMFGCMIVFSMTFKALKPTNAAYWVLMQLAMVAGFITTYPVNWWLIGRGVKEKM